MNHPQGQDLVTCTPSSRWSGSRSSSVRQVSRRGTDSRFDRCRRLSGGLPVKRKLWNLRCPRAADDRHQEAQRSLNIFVE